MPTITNLRYLIVFAICLFLPLFSALADAGASFSQSEFDDTMIRAAVGNLYMLIEGSLGALIMVVAGLMAIVAAVSGNFKSALNILVVGVGAFILRALVSLFFGSDFPEFTP